MNIIILGNYPPRQCGIGTFTQNLSNAIKAAGQLHKKDAMEVRIMAMNDGITYAYPPEVQYEIQQDNVMEYWQAAQQINDWADVCILQHEYGIFGGECGNYILNLVEQLNVPLIVTLHTVLKEPGAMQSNIIRTLARKAYRLVVMSEKAREFLTEIYKISSYKISIIEHGVPDFTIPDRDAARRAIHYETEKLLLTFGLLGRGKGIETVIRALPDIVKSHPDARYLVLGKTHPNVVRHEGEAYRESLMQLAEKLGVGEHLILQDDFVTDQELLNYLVAADAYILPYLNEAQITSGTLAYAVGAGAMIVATPFWHAQELLSEGRGILFDFENSEQLATQVNYLLDHPDKIKSYRQKTAQYGRSLKWQEKGKEYVSLLHEAIQKQQNTKTNGHKPFRLPAVNFQHMRRLSDATGILQHAKYSVPNFHEGYCLDDNARALLVASMAVQQGHHELKKLVPNYLSYINYMQRPDGLFRNFLSYDRHFLDEIGTEDAFGRTIWALGYALAYPPEREYIPLLQELFDKAFPHISSLRSPRAQAYCILGLSYYIEHNPESKILQTTMEQLTDHLIQLYYKCTDQHWQWFEEILAYGNAFLPMALFASLKVRENSEVLQVAMTATQFLEKITLHHYGYLRPIGCQSFYKKGHVVCYFDQQPIDAMAMVLLYSSAYDITKEKYYYEKALRCYEWFLGKNDLQLPLYNAQNGGCYDGLTEQGVNQNQGAESTLAYWLAHLHIMELLQKHKNIPNKKDRKLQHASQQQTDILINHLLPNSGNSSLAAEL